MSDRVPIEDVLPELKEKLESSNNLVLIAPPGAGKTTLVPMSLLTADWLNEKKILVLEPRRLAARAAAGYMARVLGEKIGQTVGYRVRLDSKAEAGTRIEFVTEGILTRMLQRDPALSGVGIVMFDEYHERSLQADLGLALCLEVQAILRPDLRLLVMSATLDAEETAHLLGDVPIVVSKGKSFPVTTCYREHSAGENIINTVCETVQASLYKDTGDILVFLPGAFEIHKTAAALKKLALPPGTRIAPLYGNLPQTLQDEAIARGNPGERKIVLSTSLAETSLTVEGIGVVIDSGLMRVPRFSLRTGLTSLETVRVSRASAEQRRGRAGRLGPGVCYRLWTVIEDSYLVAHNTPEILAADLAPLVLELALWGVREPQQLRWLDIPPEAAFAQGKQLLIDLGAIDARDSVTNHGRQLAEAGCHPRLAHMIVKGQELGMGFMACILAALLGERELTKRSTGEEGSDLRLRLELCCQALQGKDTAGSTEPSLRRVQQEVLHFRRLFQIAEGDVKAVDKCGLLLAFAYPERIGKRREDGRYLLANGRGAVLRDQGELAGRRYIAVADLDDRGTEGRIFWAAPLAENELLLTFKDSLKLEESIAWDTAAKAVRGRFFTTLGAIVVKEEPLVNPDPDKVAKALLLAIQNQGLELLPWTKGAVQLRSRLLFLHHLDPVWPDVSDEALIVSLDEWLGPYIYGLKSKEDLDRLNLVSILENLLSWEERSQLEEWAPAHILVPSGQKIPVDYKDPEAPTLAVRLQQLFGLTQTPRIAGGMVSLTLELLSPSNRPVQVTKDLASFWSSAYFEVKKDLQGRYPKHYWPDDPLKAEPTHRVRSKSRQM